MNSFTVSDESLIPHFPPDVKQRTSKFATSRGQCLSHMNPALSHVCDFREEREITLSARRQVLTDKIVAEEQPFRNGSPSTSLANCTWRR